MEKTLLTVSKEGLGSATSELQTVLVINFFRNLIIENKTPWMIFFYAEGIKLNLKGSIVEDSLLELQNRGSVIHTCQTCLNYYNTKDELAAGSAAGMADMITAMDKADKVVNL